MSAALRQLIDDRVERIEARAAEGAAAFGRPAMVRIGQVVIVLERHLQRHRHRAETLGELGGGHGKVRPTGGGYLIDLLGRSEERRGGKECDSTWSTRGSQNP